MVETKRTQRIRAPRAFLGNYQQFEATYRARATVVLFEHAADREFVNHLLGRTVETLNAPGRRAKEISVISRS